MSSVIDHCSISLISSITPSSRTAILFEAATLLVRPPFTFQLQGLHADGKTTLDEVTVCHFLDLLAAAISGIPCHSFSTPYPFFFVFLLRLGKGCDCREPKKLNINLDILFNATTPPSTLVLCCCVFPLLLNGKLMCGCEILPLGLRR